MKIWIFKNLQIKEKYNHLFKKKKKKETNWGRVW